MHYAICYVSTASNDLEEQEIHQLLEETEENNNRRNLTGILLFSEGNFFQVLEGEEDIVRGIFRQIQDDPRHHNILKIFSRKIDEGEI